MARYDVPGWDGKACKWLVKKTLKDRELGLGPHCVDRPRAVEHTADDFDKLGGLGKLLLEILRSTPQTLPIPDSFATLEKWQQLRCKDAESIAPNSERAGASTVRAFRSRR